MTRTPIAIAVAAAGLFMLVPPASAQDQMRPDADSPAGVEYQLPLERAREEASSGGGSRGGGSGGGGSADGGGDGGKPPLFGVGITRTAAAGSAGDQPTGDGTATSGGSGRDGAAGAEEDSAELRRASLGAPSGSGGDSGGLGAGWIVLAVLGAGAALGLLLRRALRDTSA